jgi:catechol 2,3-dioxygenase-like lactoylglutathione lyase family enzyme
MANFLDVTHVAVRVAGELRAAEAFYRGLFELEVAWREPVPEGLAFDAPFEAYLDAGTIPVITMLQSGALRLSLVSNEPAATSGPIDHIGLQVTPDFLLRVRERATAGNFRIIANRHGELLDFIDRFDVEWELDTRSFADPAAILEAKLGRDRGG